MRAAADEDDDVAIWSARRAAELLEDALGRPLEIEPRLGVCRGSSSSGSPYSAVERSASMFSLSIASTLGVAGAVAVRGVLDQLFLGLLEALGNAAAGLLDWLHRRVLLLVWVIDLHAGVLPARAQAETAAGRRTKAAITSASRSGWSSAMNV